MTNLKAIPIGFFLLSTNYEILWCGPGATNFQDFAKINALKHRRRL